MASISGFRFDITGASGSQGLLTPKSSWRAYILPRGGAASQDSTGTLITFDSAAVASRFAVNNWIQPGLSTANIRQVSAVGGNSIAISGAAVTVSENDQIFLIGNTQPTVTGGSATYTTPDTIIRERDDDTSGVVTNSMLTSNSNGTIQGFGDTNFYDCLIQDGNQSNQGSVIDLTIGVVEGVSVSQAAVFGATVTFNGAVIMGATTTIIVGTTISAAAIRSSDEPAANVKHADYGATGDGSTDDTAAIQSAIDSGASEIFFPPGTYIINSDATDEIGTGGGIAPASNTKLILSNGATLKAKASSAQFGNVIRLKTLSNVTIEGGVIDGNVANWTGSGEQGFGIGIFGSIDIKVRDITIKNCWGDGIFIGKNSSGASSPNSTGIHMSGVICSDNRRQGMSITSCLDSSFTNCTFRDTGQTTATNPSAGVDVEPGSSTEIVRGLAFTGCVFENNLKDGIIVFLDAANSITSGEVTITGCISRNNGEAGYNIGTGSNRVVVANCTSDNDGNASNGAINLPAGTSAGTIVLMGNIITNSVTHGILAQSNPVNCLIAGNHISGATTHGMRIVNAEGFLIVGNYVEKCGGEGLSLVGVSNSLIANNYLLSNSQTSDAASNNISMATTPCTNNTVTGNICRKDPNANQPAFALKMAANMDDNYIHGNDFFDGGKTGIISDLGAGNTIVNNRTAAGVVSSLGLLKTLADDATPSVKGGPMWVTGGTTSITDFNDGVVGQKITILSAHAVTITDGAPIILNGSADFVMAAADTLTLAMFNDQVWQEVSRTVN